MKKMLLFLCAALLSVGAWAQQPGNRPEKNRDVKKIVIDSDKTQKEYRIDRDLGKKDVRFLGIPDLTEDQQKQIKELRIAFEKESRKTNNLINEKKARLKTLQDEDNIDQKAVNKTIDEMMALQGQLMKARVDHRIKVRSLLNDEQKAAYDRSGSRISIRGDGARLNIQRAPSVKKEISIMSMGDFGFNFDGFDVEE